MSINESPTSDSLSDETYRVLSGPNRLEKVADELQIIQKDVQNRMVQQERAAERWGRMNLLIGIPAALFSGAAGAIAALTDLSQGWKVAVTLLAVVASGLTGVATTLNASRRAERAIAQQAAYEALERDTRVTLQVDLPGWSYDTAREALETIIDRLGKIDGISPRESFYRANISKGQTLTFHTQSNDADASSEAKGGGVGGVGGAGDDDSFEVGGVGRVADTGVGHGGDTNTLA